MVDTEVPMNATARKVIDAQRSRANSFPFGSVLQSPRPWQSPLRRPSSNDMNAIRNSSPNDRRFLLPWSDADTRPVSGPRVILPWRVPWRTQVLKNDKSSSLTLSLSVVHIPCGAPFQITSLAFFRIFEDRSAASAYGTI